MAWIQNGTWLSPAQGLALLITAGTTTLMLLLLVRPAVRRRTNGAIVRHLAESTRSQVVVTEMTLAGDLKAHFAPPPEPFTALHVLRMRAALLDASELGAGTGAAVDQLRFEGTLPQLPRQELLWTHGRVAGRALQRGEGTALWSAQRLDLTGSEYLTRGDSVMALQHILFELQRRYNPFLRQLLIRQKPTPHVVLTLELAYGFNAEELPALVHLLRSAGRAATIA